MQGDEALLRRLLLNLLDNAIKYTPAGGRVSVGAAHVDASYVVDVEDTGPGIPDDMRVRLFDRFFRGGRAREAGDPVTGAGLGLSIARWIAEAHGGTLTLARSDATGSMFRLTLPALGAVADPDGDQSRLATLPSSSSAIHVAS